MNTTPPRVVAGVLVALSFLSLLGSAFFAFLLLMGAVIALFVDDVHARQELQDIEDFANKRERQQ